MSGYLYITAIYSRFHGIAMYEKDSFSNCRVLYQDHSYDLYILSLEVGEIVIVNVYKPPSANGSKSLRT
jgi:exonuclease III